MVLGRIIETIIHRGYQKSGAWCLNMSHLHQLEKYIFEKFRRKFFFLRIILFSKSHLIYVNL